MRAKRCGATDHGTDAFGLSRDGKWHCWACDTGGDLIKLVAIAEGLDVRADFRKALEIAAGIAGVEDDDDFGGGKPAKKERPPAPVLPSLAERVAAAKKRGAWVWERLMPFGRMGQAYLRSRSLVDVWTMEDMRETPMRVTPEERAAKPDLERLAKMTASVGVAVPVRAVADGAIVDIRIRRIEPREDQPKVIGMLGGVVSEGPELVGCYGHPHDIRTEHIVIVEGLADYLTALMLWPRSDVLGATHAGTLPLVARHAAVQLGARGGGTVTIVAQADNMASDATWKTLPEKDRGAGDRSVDEASKNVMAILGSGACSWVECRPYKDLNDMVQAGAKIEIAQTPAATDDGDFG